MSTFTAAPVPDYRAIEEDYPHLAALRVAPDADALAGEDAGADWLAACYRLTPRVERTGRWSALLDLGICSDAEALAAVRDLGEWLTAAGLQPLAGIAPSVGLAQLAGLRCGSQRPLALLTPAETPAFLSHTPVTLLPYLHPRGLVTPEIVERLQRYGLRTLAHVARVGELALRRQFGEAGSLLAAIALGRDARPLCPTPPPAELRIRGRFATPATAAELLASLPHLAERAAARLRLQGRQARTLRSVVRWESGAVTRSRLTLRRYTDDPALLAQELRRLLAHACAPGELATTAPASPDSEAACQERVEELRLTLTDFAPAAPAQAMFWRTRAQQAATLTEVAETLARRHGRALLLRPRLTAPAAIFSEERYRFAPPAAPDVPDAMEAIGTADVAGAESMAGAQSMAGADGDAWRDVPRRLHWW